MSALRPPVILSCEHGGSRIPSRYAGLFSSPRARRALASHRGADLGALPCARALARALDAPLHAVTISRLLVEVNRSPGHRALWSEWSARLSVAERQRVLERYYLPHRTAVEAVLRRQLAPGGSVLHISVHSFTAKLGRERRRADIGLLYDPRRPRERTLCERWQSRIERAAPGLRVRRNYPYRGAADGFTTHLRRSLGVRYLGIELELNQETATDRAGRAELMVLLARALGGGK